MALRRPATGNPFTDLAELWLEGLTASHDPGCGCGGLFSPVLDARQIEEDFLDYLVDRYRKQNAVARAELVNTRRMSPAAPFESWIAALSDAPINKDEKSALFDDLRVFLESLASRSSRTPGICY